MVVQTRQPGLEQFGGHRHDAAVDLANGALCVAGVFVFDNGLHLALGIAHDAPVAGWVVERDGQQSQVLSCTRVDQGLQGVGLGQGHIAREHHHDAIVWQVRHRLLHRVAGAQLRHLAREFEARIAIGLLECAFDLIGAVARDHNGVARIELVRGVDHMVHQGLARQGVKHLG